MRRILALALDSFEANRKSYHLSCDPTRDPDGPDRRRGGRADGRRRLTPGPARRVRRDPRGVRTQMYQVWNDHEEEHYRIIADHFVRHLEPFARYAR
jgi:hypothetical protein